MQIKTSICMKNKCDTGVCLGNTHPQKVQEREDSRSATTGTKAGGERLFLESRLKVKVP